MKRIFATFVLVSVAIALPQAPLASSPAIPSGYKPTSTSPKAASPKIVGQLPTDGVKGLPWPGFGDFGMQLGFDPSKATPDASGGKCQTTPNGRFCFSKSGGSFMIPHPGGAFNGIGWNPFPGSAGTGTPGGLLIGSIGSPDDGAEAAASRFVQTLRVGDVQGLKSLIVDMQEYVAKLEHAELPMETGVPESVLN